MCLIRERSPACLHEVAEASDPHMRPPAPTPWTLIRTLGGLVSIRYCVSITISQANCILQRLRTHSQSLGNVRPLVTRVSPGDAGGCLAGGCLFGIGVGGPCPPPALSADGRWHPW